MTVAFLDPTAVGSIDTMAIAFRKDGLVKFQESFSSTADALAGLDDRIVPALAFYGLGHGGTVELSFQVSFLAGTVAPALAFDLAFLSSAVPEPAPEQLTLAGLTLALLRLVRRSPRSSRLAPTESHRGAGLTALAKLCPGEKRLARRSPLHRARVRLRRSWPTSARRRRLWKKFRRLPVHTQIGAALVAAALVSVGRQRDLSGLRKPTELFLPLSVALYKTPAETWGAYSPLFRRHATPVITAEFLAALAQVEASGNPIVRTYWRWSWVPDPFELYRPASSAVGMYQITDGTFEQAKRYCIHDHAVVEEGPWYAWRSCWFNELYFRVVPSHAIELTSAYLDRTVAATLARHGRESTALAESNGSRR